MTEQSHPRFHVQYTNNHKSLRGGAISLIALCYVRNLAGRTTHRLVTNYRPDIISVNKALSSDDAYFNGTIYLNMITKFLSKYIILMEQILQPKKLNLI